MMMIRPGLWRNDTARIYGRGESVRTMYSSLVYVCARACDKTVRPAWYICGATDNHDTSQLAALFRDHWCNRAFT